VTVPRLNTPFAAPQVSSVICVVIADGPLIFCRVAEVEKIQSLLSFTVMVCDPAAKLGYLVV